MATIALSTYDANGSTLTDPSGKSYTWDFENRLTQAVIPGTGTTTFRYGPFGRRIQKSGPLGTTNYLYDNKSVIEEIDAGGNVLARYSQGPGVDSPLSELRSGIVSYYQQDAISSVTSLSGSSGNIAETYAYDSFGNVLSSTGNVVNPLQYTGREFDTETRIYLYRARYYDSTTGRFLSEDPIAFVGGTNFYIYVNNDPTQFVDPSGLLGIDPATQQQIDSLRGLFPDSRYAGGTIIVFMPCSEVQKILEQNGYSTANNTPTSWYNSWLFNSPAHQGAEVHQHGGFHFVLRDSTEKCPFKTCTITDMHNDPHDPLDQPIPHIIFDALPWWLGDQYSKHHPPLPF